MCFLSVQWYKAFFLVSFFRWCDFFILHTDNYILSNYLQLNYNSLNDSKNLPPYFIIIIIMFMSQIINFHSSVVRHPVQFCWPKKNHFFSFTQKIWFIFILKCFRQFSFTMINVVHKISVQISVLHRQINANISGTFLFSALSLSLLLIWFGMWKNKSEIKAKWLNLDAL